MNANPPLFPLGSVDLLLSCLFVPLLPTLYTLIRRCTSLEEARAVIDVVLSALKVSEKLSLRHP
jgi:hypothetical protein